MPRLTTPDGFILEFEDEASVIRALSHLRGGTPGSLNAAVELTAPEASSSAKETVEVVARSDGQRQLLKALAAMSGMVTRDELAKAVGADKYVMLGTLGAIYANAAERKIDPTQIVRRERYRASNGRRAYRYGAGPLLQGLKE